MTANHYIVATIKPWNIAAFESRRTQLPGSWSLIRRPEELTLERLQEFSPRYVFFPHWSWVVAADLIDTFECVCFHMTNVPYGRGGSPLQNLILRGHGETVMTALRMTSELDAGPVYIKRPLSLAGSAQVIFERAAELMVDMMAEIAKAHPAPTPQIGAPTVFRRRTPAQSVLPQDGSPSSIYDFIRMLDAETYPKAFIEWGLLRLEFDQAKMSASDTVEARVVIRSKAAL